MLWHIVNKELRIIPQATITIAFKLQRGLHWRITEHTRCTIKTLTVLMAKNLRTDNYFPLIKG